MEGNNCIMNCRACGFCQHDYSFLDDDNFDWEWENVLDYNHEEDVDELERVGLSMGSQGVI